MSIEHSNPAQIYELPATNTGLEGMIPEAQESLGAQLEQDRAAVQGGIEGKFTRHHDLVREGVDGSQELTLQMPWQGGGARRPETATIVLSRKTDVAGSAQTDLTFSSKHAWTSRVRVTTTADGTRVQQMITDEQGALIPGNYGSEYIDASTWRKNLEVATPANQNSKRRGIGRFLGRKALDK